jgi:hypothetical protein
MQRHEEHGRPATIIATDDLPLVGRVDEPEDSADATVLALRGVGVPQRIFRHFRAALPQTAQRNIVPSGVTPA